MRIPLRRLGYLVVAVGAALGMLAAAGPAGAASPPGYTLEAPHLLGLTPAGYRVYVVPSAHARTLAAQTAAAVTELRRLGLPVSWSGYGTPRHTEGIVTVSESRTGCGNARGVVGMTYPSWTTLPSGHQYLLRADVYICPTLFTGYPSWEIGPVVRHELGHAVGLAHTNYVYARSYQLMNAVVHPGVTDYRSGDVAGLRRLAAGTAQVRREMPPVGHYDSLRINANRTMTASGWALLRYYPANGVTITLTDNGRLVGRSGTPVMRPDVNRAYAVANRHGFSLTVPVNPAGHHRVCATATSTVDAAAHATLGCWSW